MLGVLAAAMVPVVFGARLEIVLAAALLARAGWNHASRGRLPRRMVRTRRH